MSQVEKYLYALQLLKELNCPNHIMEFLEIWGMFVREDEIKLHNWQALSAGGVVEGEARELREITPEITERSLMEEHRPYKSQILGSIPSAPTIGSGLDAKE